jgi:hypothetical protein
MTINEVKEQLQENIITYLDGMGDEVIGDLCTMVTMALNELDTCYTEADMKKAHEFGAKYVKGTIAEAQEYTLDKLLK